MRSTIPLEHWQFSKTDSIHAADWQSVTLPHTWNNLDGQDGGGDYYRGRCWYQLELPKLPADQEVYVEFEGVNHIAEVYLNGEKLGTHEGGFSTFRFEIGSRLHPDKNRLSVSAYNGDSHVYPQSADFTFFGGIYRPVRLVLVNKAHFDLRLHGSCGVFVTPKAEGGGAQLRIDAFSVESQGGELVAEVLDAEGNLVCEQRTAVEANHSSLQLAMTDVHRWNGMREPYLYKARLTLVVDAQAQDRVEVAFGVREYSVDAEKGFFLNGAAYPLHGVSRHQDRQDMGWAITRREHAEDAALIQEVGANTIRLAHYQHANEFYSICDETGFVLWAEIPFISMFDEDPRARENTLSQMTELVVQNYNHPSICFWGISNEIGIGGESPALLDNLKAVHALCKKLDPTRLTTMAQLTMTEYTSEHNFITDVLSYNHYFGWYMGSVEENGPALDDFHKLNPQRPMGVSEYGAEANISLHSAHPHVRDYSEEYQALYHENMLKTFAERPYLWSTHVWNMFDFAADARDEGGAKGRNNKGLVTYDRKIRKDSFFIYKAYWTDVPFVHITGRRFLDRLCGKADFKVYSNCPAVSLSVNGAPPVTLTGNKVFVFPDVALRLGDNSLVATAAGAQEDRITLHGVETANPAYTLPDDDGAEGIEGIKGVENWFEGQRPQGTELQFPDGYFSIHDTISDIMTCPEALQALKDIMSATMSPGEAKKSGGMMSMMLKMMKNNSLESLLQIAGSRIPKGARLLVNERLNQIKKE